MHFVALYCYPLDPGFLCQDIRLFVLLDGDLLNDLNQNKKSATPYVVAHYVVSTIR